MNSLILAKQSARSPAQAIGEPGTQLTMRTFHAGGTASVGGDITQGLPRVEEVFEKRNPKSAALVSPVSGTISSIKEEGGKKLIFIMPDIEDKGATGKDGEIELETHLRRVLFVKVGDKVSKGRIITDGSASIDEIFEYAGRDAAMDYIIREIGKIYELQGETVSRKHIEIIVKQMFSRERVRMPATQDLPKAISWTSMISKLRTLVSKISARLKPKRNRRSWESRKSRFHVRVFSRRRRSSTPLAYSFRLRSKVPKIIYRV